MQKLIITILGILISGIALAQSDIQVKVVDIESAKGKIILMLFNEEEGFPGEKDKAFRRVKVDAQRGNLTYTFQDIPYDTYALSVVHDENNNDELDKNFIGMPKEKVGVTNQSSFGKPSFKRSKFELDSDSKILNLEITFLN